jgi:hypothetical protein
MSVQPEEVQETEAEPIEEEAPPADPEGKALFDRSTYETEELALPKIDGEGIDKIAVKVSGRVWLERGSPEHVALVRDVRLGQEVTLVCEATVRMPVPGYSTDKEGDLDVISLTRHFAVTSVSRAVGD